MRPAGSMNREESPSHEPGIELEPHLRHAGGFRPDLSEANALAIGFQAAGLIFNEPAG